MKNLLFSLILLCACSVSQSAKAQLLLEALEGEITYSDPSNPKSPSIPILSPRNNWRCYGPRMSKITLITPSATHEIEVPDDQYILDMAEEYGIDLPYSGRAGADSTSAALVVSGNVNNEDQSFLDDYQLAAGFVILDVARPCGDAIIKTHMEDYLHTYYDGWKN